MPSFWEPWLNELHVGVPIPSDGVHFFKIQGFLPPLAILANIINETLKGLAEGLG